jgi:hypothetical protein
MPTFPLVHISKMTGKLEGFHAISTNTKTNDFCIKQNASKNTSKICTKCYSHTMLSSYRKNMQPSLQRNSDLLSSRVLKDHELPTILDAFFRFDAHGELINTAHLINLVNIATHNSHCNFALWTKRNDLIAKYFKNNEKPKNLILIYSNPLISRIMVKPPKHFDKTFNNVLETEHVEKQNCTGQKCKDCLLCYKHNDVKTIVEMVKKYN